VLVESLHLFHNRASSREGCAFERLWQRLDRSGDDVVALDEWREAFERVTSSKFAREPALAAADTGAAAVDFDAFEANPPRYDAFGAEDGERGLIALVAHHKMKPQLSRFVVGRCTLNSADPPRRRLIG
jgi:hypothetical protein